MLPYFDRNKYTTLQMDASEKGFGTVILQDNKPIYIASRSLTPAEKNYQNLEQECMGCDMGHGKVPFLPLWQRVLAPDGPKASDFNIQEASGQCFT